MPFADASKELAEALADERDRALNRVLKIANTKVENYPGGPRGYVEAKFPGLFDATAEALGDQAPAFLAGFTLGMERATYGL